MNAVLPKVLQHLQQGAGGQTDGQLLARFVAVRDEDAFAVLVHRHGPMVLGVCRRVLRNEHDAEDAFQASFLVLARKAAAVANRDSVGCYLYAVAYHTALEAARANARRRARERQVEEMPHPKVAPVEAQDWRALLDREVSRLSEKYRTALVLCDLGGRPQRQAATLLGVSLSTLSSRLTRARTLLAKRLSARGLVVSCGGLTMAFAVDLAAAQVSAAQASSTARVAALVVAGQLAGETTAPVLLMKGVMQAMLMKKVRLTVCAILVTAALGAFGLASRPGGEVQAQEASPPEGRAGAKAAGDLAALRRENEDLRGTVRVLLKEIRTLQQSLESARTQPAAGKIITNERNFDILGRIERNDLTGAEVILTPTDGFLRLTPEQKDGGAEHEAEAALKALREARDPEARRRAAEALWRATQRVREQVNPGSTLQKKGA
jgi:RNA polymerase sigma factor (sigma-70 family)